MIGVGCGGTGTPPLTNFKGGVIMHLTQPSFFLACTAGAHGLWTVRDCDQDHPSVATIIIAQLSENVKACGKIFSALSCASEASLSPRRRHKIRKEPEREKEQGNEPARKDGKETRANCTKFAIFGVRKNHRRQWLKSDEINQGEFSTASP